MANLVSFVILAFLLFGRSLAHKNRRLHAAWMSFVIASDFALIAYLTLARRALSKVNSEMPPLLMVHLTFAISTVVLYLVAVTIGIRLLRGAQHRNLMRKLDRLIVPCRILTFLTSLALQLSAKP